MKPGTLVQILGSNWYATDVYACMHEKCLYPEKKLGVLNIDSMGIVVASNGVGAYGVFPDIVGWIWHDEVLMVKR